MKNIFKIHFRDLKNVFSNWVALIVVLGLIILPSLYAWFNIKSSWDPYSNTKGIKVAVVNQDKGATLKGKKINLGSQIVDELKQNEQIGWKFMSEKEAEDGVKTGEFYASILIPESFTDKLLSILKDKPEKPSLIYTVNEKKNAVAPKITQKGVTYLQNEVSKTFVKTVNGIIFDLFNQFGVELEKSKPKLKDLSEILFFIDSKIPDINKSLTEITEGVTTLEEFLVQINKDMPLIEDTLNKATRINKEGNEFLMQVSDNIPKILPFIKEDLILAKEIIVSTEEAISKATSLLERHGKKAEEVLLKVKDKYNLLIDKLNAITDFLNSLDKLKDKKVISRFVTKLEDIEDILNKRIETIDLILDGIDKGEKPLEKIKELDNDKLSSMLDEIIDNFDTRVAPEIEDFSKDLVEVTENIDKIFMKTQDDLPEIKDILQKAQVGTIKGIEDLKILQEKLPSILISIHSVTEKLKKLDADEALNEIIKILKNDAKRESEFLASPINITEKKIYPIPNYGSAMTPFFTTLSLWVGALILVSILSVHVKENHNLFSVYFGRYLTFMSIALCQALIVSLGDIFILKAYVVNKLGFVLASMFISVIFTMIVYTLVSVFGNIGKALAVILLVLQISASGGTFPIEVTPLFFQHLNPFLPFTYAISLMREMVGGYIFEVVLSDIGILILYFLVSILIALLLKKKLSNINKYFVEKFKDSGLVEE